MFKIKKAQGLDPRPFNCLYFKNSKLAWVNPPKNKIYFVFRMNGLERKAWFRPLDKIFVPKWEERGKSKLGTAAGLAEWASALLKRLAIFQDDIDSRGNPSLSSEIGSAMLFSSG